MFLCNAVRTNIMKPKSCLTNLAFCKVTGSVDGGDQYTLFTVDFSNTFECWTAMPSEKAKSNGHKLNARKFHLNTRNCFVVLRLVMHWTRLPSEAVKSPSLKILKTWLDNDLSNLLWLNLLWAGQRDLGDLKRYLPISPTLWLCICWD